MLNLYKYHSTPEQLSSFEDRHKIRPEFAYDYAHDQGHRIPELEPTILKDPFITFQYARFVIKDRWPEAEPIIMKNPRCAYEYAKVFLKHRWPEAEPYIQQRQLIWNLYQTYFKHKEKRDQEENQQNA